MLSGLEKVCMECTLPICDDKSAECAFVQITRTEPSPRRGPGRPPKSEKKEKPPTVAQYTDGRYHLRRKRSEQVPIELETPQEFSPEYRAWVGKILNGK